MLTTEAFNALLKVLEEPPGHVVFVFATTEPHKIPATIVSRCQKFDFRSFTVDEIAAQLAQGGEDGRRLDRARGALALIALHSEGGMRDALGYLDQCIAFASGDHRRSRRRPSARAWSRPTAWRSSPTPWPKTTWYDASPWSRQPPTRDET